MIWYASGCKLPVSRLVNTFSVRVVCRGMFDMCIQIFHSISISSLHKTFNSKMISLKGDKS